VGVEVNQPVDHLGCKGLRMQRVAVAQGQRVYIQQESSVIVVQACHDNQSIIVLVLLQSMVAARWHERLTSRQQPSRRQLH
jgi:putative component of toxin-antitoxin plasmid stabilization module